MGYDFALRFLGGSGGGLALLAAFPSLALASTPFLY